MFIKGKIFENIQKVNVIHLLKYCLFIIEKYDKYVETAFRVCLKHVSLNVNWFVYLRLLNVCFFWHQQCFISNIYKTMLMSDENLAAFLICIYNDYICIKNQAWLFTWRNFFFFKVEWNFLFLQNLILVVVLKSGQNILYTKLIFMIKNSVNAGFQKTCAMIRGVRQGCPLSALLYLVLLEILSIKMKCNQYIKGTPIYNCKIKNTQHAFEVQHFI